MAYHCISEQIQTGIIPKTVGRPTESEPQKTRKNGETNMKKITTRILSLILMVGLVFALVSCGSAKTFTRGKTTGNTYKSDFLGLSFTKPGDWYFYSDDQIAQLLGTTTEILNDTAAFEAAAETQLIDFMAATEDGTNNVNVTFVKGSMVTQVDASIDATMDTMKKEYEHLGGTCTVSAKTERQLGKVAFTEVTMTVSAGIVKMNQFCYFCKIGNTLVNIVCTSATGTTMEDFEAMFS